MDRRLIVFRIVLVIFAVVILIIASLGIYSSFIDPIINQTVFVDVPSEDQISWSFEEDSLDIDTAIWINNTGYYALEDVNLYILMEGLDATFYDETMNIERIESGEKRQVPISFSVDMDSLPGDITIYDLIFDNATFYIRSHLTASYPFSLMNLEFDYESTFEWLGIVNNLELFHQEASVVSARDGRSMIEIPFEIDTNDVISGSAQVDLALWDEARQTKYAETSLNVPLGRNHYSWITFELSEEYTEYFIKNSETVHFVSTVYLADSDVSFDYTMEHYWGAPLRDFDFGDIEVDENYANSSFYFVNDSTGTLDIRIDIELDNETTGLAGGYYKRIVVQPGDVVNEVISMYLIDVPDLAIIRIEEHFSGYVYERVVEEL